MILDTKYPKLVKSTNFLDLKLMGPSCFIAVTQVRTTTKKKFLGNFPLQKYGRFPALPEEEVEPEPIINVVVAEEHDMQFIRENLREENVEETSEAQESERQLPTVTAERLAEILQALQGSLGNPPASQLPTTTIVQDDKDDLSDTDSKPLKRRRSEPSLVATEENPTFSPVQTEYLQPLFSESTDFQE
ncbi:hypothetical protein Hanom_Chr15g01373811 [Helianthus anomalus]